jgi:glyceraldehyde-3-phosphate dehydrogenase (NADP+)
LNLAISKLIPSLVVGNAVVFKSATNGSGVGYYIAKAFNDTKIPAGVFNFVTGKGSEIGAYLISDKLNGITFTGSALVGKNISAQSKMTIETYELGGNDAAIIRKDADLDNAIKEVVKGALSYSGQRCTAIKRVLIDKTIKEEFVKRLTKAISKLSVGKAINNCDITAVVDKKSADKIELLVKESLKQGAKAITQFKRKDNLIFPMIMGDVKPNMAIFQEEQFGPIIPITTITSDKEAIELNNNTVYGLQASIFTKNIEKAKEIALQLEVGSVNINGSSQRGPDILPFTGVKDSGLNSQGIKSSLLTASRPMNIVNNY